MKAALELVALGLLCAGFYIVARQYPTLPDRVPIHFGITGEPDNWAPRPMIWLLPVVGVVTYVVMSMPQLARPPVREELMLLLLKVEVMGLFLYIERGQIEVACGRAARLGPAIWVLTALVVLTPLLARMF